MSLGVNIDHIAVLREARKINDPDPLMALAICAQSGADQITIHLREDRRHIHDEDVRRIIENSVLPVNLECSINPEIIDIVSTLRPHRVTLVPEKREEVTTEGGLDVCAQYEIILNTIKKLTENEIEVSLFIDPTDEAVDISCKLGAQWVELHTGTYANVYAMRYSSLSHSHHAIDSLKLSRKDLNSRLNQSYEDIVNAANKARIFGLKVAAGHGLNYQNVTPIVQIDTIEELNIGQSIIARSIFTGLQTAVSDMKVLCQR
ncbi:pyridoxine 5'-phosphate synthase [Sulfuricurvum sp.]|uniref:pyridoxine 5'-phosphate synthase n=1 Tax=Sulfuricurvum sp. TaxID=2025608 RepID=UPI003BB675E7